MLLTTKGRRLQTNCCTIQGGNNVAGLYGLGLTARRQLRMGNGTRFNQAVSEAGSNQIAGFPNGYRHPGCWVWPIASGSIASINQIDGAGESSAAGALGKNAEAGLSGAGDVASVAQLIVSLVSALSGAGDITQAEAIAYLQLAAALSGEGSVVAALNAIAFAESQANGAGDLDATSTATGTLAAGLTVTGDLLTTSNIANAVWSALAEGDFTYAQCLQIIASACAGKTSNTGQTFRDLSDTKDRIAGTVSGGERTAVTYDLD